MSPVDRLRRIERRLRDGELGDDGRWLAEALDAAFAETGDARFRHAACVLRGKKGGRPPADDAAACERVAWLMETGRARSIRHASEMVAASLGEGAKISSIARRLRKKLGRNNFSPNRD